MARQVLLVQILDCCNIACFWPAEKLRKCVKHEAQYNVQRSYVQMKVDALEAGSGQWEQGGSGEIRSLPGPGLRTGDGGGDFHNRECIFAESRYFELYQVEMSVDMLCGGHAWNVCDGDKGIHTRVFTRDQAAWTLKAASYVGRGSRRPRRWKKMINACVWWVGAGCAAEDGSYLEVEGVPRPVAEQTAFVWAPALVQYLEWNALPFHRRLIWEVLEYEGPRLAPLAFAFSEELVLNQWGGQFKGWVATARNTFEGSHVIAL
eukprot:g55840.t1